VLLPSQSSHELREQLPLQLLLALQARVQRGSCLQQSEPAMAHVDPASVMPANCLVMVPAGAMAPVVVASNGVGSGGGLVHPSQQ
jgi:hypothetical protein